MQIFMYNYAVWPMDFRMFLFKKLVDTCFSSSIYFPGLQAFLKLFKR